MSRPTWPLGSVYEAKQDRDKAIGIYRRYLQGVNPRNREIRHHLIRLQVSAKQYDEALQELEGMLAEDPSDLDAQLRMGLVYGEQKNYPKAIQQLNQILTVRPSELKVRDYFGYLYEETKDYTKAIDAYRHNLTLEPSYFEGHLHLGVLQYRLKQYADAIQHLREASRLESQAAGILHRARSFAFSSLSSTSHHFKPFWKGFVTTRTMQTCISMPGRYTTN